MTAKTLFINTLMHHKYGALIWLAAYGFIWILIPVFSNASLPVDSAEILAWGREWPIGLYRHPPMKVWLSEIVYQLTGNWTNSAYLLSVLAYSIGQYGIYLTLKKATNKALAFSALATSPLIFYFGIHLPQWSANISQYPFVGLILFTSWQALKFAPKSAQSNVWWLLTGILSAGGILSKYSFILLIAAILFALLSHKDLRKNISVSGIFIAAITCLVLITPNLIWVYIHADLVESYIKTRVNSQPLLWGGISAPLGTIGLLIVISILPAFVIRNGLTGETNNNPDKNQTKLLWIIGWLAIFPSFIAAILAGITGNLFKDLWFLANFFFIPPFLILLFHQKLSHNIAWTKPAQYWIFGVMIITAIGYPIERYSHYILRHSPSSWTPIMPIMPLTNEVMKAWKTGLEKSHRDQNLLPKIIAGNHIASSVANHIPQRAASWLEHSRTELSPWATKEQLEHYGAVLINQDMAQYSDLSLCTVYKTDFKWKNKWGQDAMIVPITIILPVSDACLNSSQ